MSQTQSLLMSLCLKLGMKKAAWTLRHLHVPVKKNGLVLDLGSGQNPYPRANVLLDAYEDTVERYNIPLIIDRPMVYGIVEKLPFKDKTFDFIIASHVLEHIASPEKMISELQRVGKAGYIETPDAFFETINPYRFHRLEITDIENRLYIKKKQSWCSQPEMVKLFSNKVKNDPQWQKYIRSFPTSLYTRFYWKDTIDYTILNPEVNANWKLPEVSKKTNNQDVFHTILTNSLRYLLSQRSRNKKIDLINILQCPTCGNQKLKQNTDYITCCGCNVEYKKKNGIPKMFPHNL